MVNDDHNQEQWRKQEDKDVGEWLFSFFLVPLCSPRQVGSGSRKPPHSYGLKFAFTRSMYLGVMEYTIILVHGSGIG